MDNNLLAVLIGIVEGLTEFLPISSTGHMILVGSLFGFEGEKASVFEVFIQLGAIMSVVILYRDKYVAMLQPSRMFKTEGLSMFHVMAGIVPVMGIGYLSHSFIKAYLFSPFTVMIGLVLGGILMLVAEKMAKPVKVNEVEQISLRQAFWVGAFQILALWPGFSRSGSTISGGIFLGLSRKVAAEFSFIIAAPLMFVACIYDLLKIFNKLNLADLQMFAIGFVVAFGVAYISIIWFLRFLNKSSLTSFAYYRFILAIVSYWYFAH